MASYNLDRMSLKDLVELDTRIKAAIAGIRDRQRNDVKNELAALAERRGFNITELYGSGRGAKGSKVAIKYRNKDNPLDTWTGRGRQPRWLAAKLAKGGKLNDFAV